MLCSSCGSENPHTQKFCGECGAPLPGICTTCGATNPPGQKFCGECGAGLVGEGARPRILTAGAVSPQVATTERRLVSVLFADLVGFTALSESRDAEEVRELLSRYFESCRATVGRYGGVIEKFIGDAVMAVWGSPVAHEDDAERAVRAALEVTEVVSSLGIEVGAPDLRARGGVLTGEAAVSLGAEDEGMVAGDLVNTASRIQSIAPPGAVYVGESTKRSSDGVIAYERAGSFELKGKTEPVELWRAARVAGLRRATGLPTALEPPFTGRDRELRLIKELFHDSADHGRVHLVSVQGVGGIGKSRLLWEFNKYIDGLVKDVWWHQGRCLAYGDGVTFWALAEMVRGRAGILEDEESSTALPKLLASIDAHVSDPRERRFVAPRLAHLLGLEEGASGDQENLFAACRIFFERLADDGPSVMVFEDLHWADSALLDFIEYLADWSRDRPIFLLTLSRPELADRRPTWGADARNFTSIFLEPLPSEDMDALLAGPVPGLPVELRARILERAEGIPFYAVETVRMLIDRGVLVRENGGFRVTASVQTLEVPESLQALIAARLDGLASQERRVLQHAAVLGRTFTLQGLNAVSGVPEGELEGVLASLIRKEVLSISIDPLLSDRGQYGFLQDLVKKVAYDTMSRRERKARHLAAAAYLRSVADEDEVVELVAAHFLDAYRAAAEDEDAQRIKADALDMLRGAGERAASLGAHEEAQRYAERAIDLADDPLEQAALHERAGTWAAVNLSNEDAKAHFERAISLFGTAGATHPAARVSARLGEVLWDQGRIADALEMIERSFEILTGDEPDADLAELAAQWGRFSYFAGQTREAMARTERALEIAEALDIPEVLSMALNTKSLVLVTLQRPSEALGLVEHALAVALDHDRPSAALRAYNNLADLLDYGDRYAEADDRIAEGLSLARRIGNRYWETALLGHCYSKFALGRWDEAIETLAEIPDDEFARTRIGFTQGFVAFGAAIEVHRGQFDTAARRLDRFAELEASADVQEVAEHACGAARLNLARGEPKDALRFAEIGISAKAALSFGHSCVKESFVAGLEAALELGDREKVEEILGVVESDRLARRALYFHAHSMRAVARLGSLEDDADDADQAFRSAIGSFREIGFPFWMGVTLLEYGEWLTERRRASDASDLLDEAHAIFERLGARPWGERVAAISPRALTGR